MIQPAPASAIDLSFLRAATVVLAEHSCVDLWLVGCGGTGSCVSRAVAQIARVLEEGGRKVRLTFVDPDTVEPKNVPRQMFAEAEIGLNKAEALALRYAAAWGLEIRVVAEPFEARMLGHDRDLLTLLIGCVDNAKGRQALHAALERNDRPDPLYGHRAAAAPNVWWLDCGNSNQAGQVQLGSTVNIGALRDAFPTETVCTRLPSPGLQSPELLEPRPEELAESKLSCAELALANAQSLMVNHRVAAEAGDFLSRLLLSRNLRRFATFFDCEAGTARSTYCTPEQVAALAGLGAEPKRRRRRRAA